MNEQAQWSSAGILAAVGGGLGLLFFLLVTGFAGSRIVEVDRPGWTGLVVMLAASGALVLVSAVWGWRQYRKQLASVDPHTAAASKLQREANSVLASLSWLLAYGLSLVLIRQTYWVWAPWAALVSMLVCGTLVVYWWQRSLHFADRYYSQLSPVALWQELQRYKPKHAKYARRYLLFASALASFMVLFLVAEYVFGWDDAAFPPRRVDRWIPLLNSCYVVSMALGGWSQQRIIERWRQTFIDAHKPGR